MKRKKKKMARHAIFPNRTIWATDGNSNVTDIGTKNAKTRLAFCASNLQLQNSRFVSIGLNQGEVQTIFLPNY